MESATPVLVLRLTCQHFGAVLANGLSNCAGPGKFNFLRERLLFTNLTKRLIENWIILPLLKIKMPPFEFVDFETSGFHSVPQ